MTDEMIDLGRRAVACKGWRWMPGVLAWSKKHCVDLQGRDLGEIEDSMRVQEVETGCLIGLPTGKSIAYSWSDFDLLPDLTDPATVGCLLALVREAHPGCAIWVARDCVVDPLDDTEYMLDEREGWTVCGGSGDDYLSPYGSGRTEAEALVAALEAAPR